MINFEETNLNLGKKIENDQLANNSQKKDMENWTKKMNEELNIINKQINIQNVKIDKLESKLSIITYRDSIRDVLFFLLSLANSNLKSSKYYAPYKTISISK